MEAIAVVSKGLEETAAKEIKELIKSDAHISDLCVKFNFKKYEQLCELCYKAQSVDRIVLLLHSFASKNILEDFKKYMENADFSKWLKRKKFRVECQRTGNHGFRSVDVEELGAKIIAKKFSSVPDYKNPDIFIFVYIVGDKCSIGIDFSGFELNKRPYKIFLNSSSLRGTIAYALVRESGFEKKEVLLDPFAKDGMVAIEAAMWRCNMPISYYKKEKFAFLKLDLGIDTEKFFKKIDKKISRKETEIFCYDSTFKNIDSCKKNAKIAGIEKEIKFSRTELERLDLKFSKKSVDRIVTFPITLKGPIIEKIYNEFFYQAEYILKDSGTVAIATQFPEQIMKHAEKHSFRLNTKKEVWSGEQNIFLMAFSKK